MTTTRASMDFDPSHPKNQQILRYLRSGDSKDPQTIPDRYICLGTHPELVERLWDELGEHLPEDCKWVVGNQPVLMLPANGVVFGVAGGTHFYSMRLPPESQLQLEASKLQRVENAAHEFGLRWRKKRRYIEAQLGVNPIGTEWCAGKWTAAEAEHCLAAYRWAH